MSKFKKQTRKLSVITAVDVLLFLILIRVLNELYNAELISNTFRIAVAVSLIIVSSVIVLILSSRILKKLRKY